MVCPSNKILNPITGRCVLKTGAVGKKILQTTPKKAAPKKAAPKKAAPKKAVAKKAAPKKAAPSECPSNKILNPITGRCVSKTGVIGKKILQNAPKRTTSPPKRSNIKISDRSKIFFPDEPIISDRSKIFFPAEPIISDRSKIFFPAEPIISDRSKIFSTFEPTVVSDRSKIFSTFEPTVVSDRSKIFPKSKPGQNLNRKIKKNRH